MRSPKPKTAIMIVVFLVALAFLAVSSSAEGPGGTSCDWVTCFQWCWEAYGECKSENAEPTDGCYLGLSLCWDADHCCTNPGPDGF